MLMEQNGPGPKEGQTEEVAYMAEENAEGPTVDDLTTSTSLDTEDKEEEDDDDAA
jgi:hypothetical protein